MKITKSQIKQIINEELDEGIMDTLKSAGSAVKKAFTGDKLPPLGHMQAGNAASRKLDVEVKKIYLDVLVNPQKFKDFFPTFLGFHSIAEKSRGADAAATSKKIYNKLKSSDLYRNLRSLMQNGKLYLGKSSGRMKDWKGDINPIEKENYVISPWVANIVLQSGNIYDLEESDRNGYIPPGYGDVPAEEEGSEQASAEQMNESKMKITKTQLKQIIKEEISKVLSEGPADVPEPGLPSQNMNMKDPEDVLKQMIYTKVPGKEFGYKIASPENVQDYLEWIQNGVDDNYITGNSPKEGMAKLQEQLAQAVKVIKALQQGIAQGLGTREGDKIFLPDALGLGHEDKMFQGFPDEPLGDAYELINRTDWVKELSERSLFFDLINMFKTYYRRVIEPGDYG